MPRGVKKEHLPFKTCVTCGRPFTWRKKWEKVWDEVTTCSKSCNRKRRLTAKEAQAAGGRVRMNVENELDDGSSTSQEATLVVLQEEQQQEEESDQQQSLEEEQLHAVSKDDDSSNSSPFSIASSSQEPQDVDEKTRRKLAKKAKKAERRAQRQGRGDPTTGQKNCDKCDKSVDLLIRCIYEPNGNWKMVCGKCWHVVSGGVVDGDAAHPHYRYGGLWKNRRRVQTG